MSSSENYLRIAWRHKPRSLPLAVLTRFAKPESNAEKILSLVAEITPTAASELSLREGDPIWASAKATEITTYPR